MQRIYRFKFSEGNFVCLPVSSAVVTETEAVKVEAMKAIPVVVLSLPENAVVTSAASTTNGPVIWAMCNPNAETAERFFVVVKTGQDLPDSLLDALHVATVAYVEKGKSIVDHIFELPAYVKKALLPIPN